MAGFGIGTDHFGLATADLVLIEANSAPKPQSRETAQDEDGNMVAEGQYDGAAAESVECLYRLIANTLNINTLALGYILNGATHLCIERIAVATANGEWPTIRVTGFKDVTNYTDFPAFTLDSITISALKKAQGLDFSVDAGCRLISSAYEIAGEMSFALDNLGDVGVMGFSGAEATISGEAVEVSTAVGWTPGGTWTETQGPGANTGNITHATSPFEAQKIVTPDT